MQYRSGFHNYHWFQRMNGVRMAGTVVSAFIWSQLRGQVAHLPYGQQFAIAAQVLEQLEKHFRDKKQ